MVAPTEQIRGAMTRLSTRRMLAVMLVAVVSTGVTGCVQSGASGSRHAMYDSIDALARDSSVIVVGSVTDQREDLSAGAPPPSRISTVEVINTPANPSLGENLDAESAPVAVGDVIDVREDAGASLLRPGQEYLLFLTPSMLPGDEAAQFFITGAVAGAYERDGDQFARIVTDSGDDLPDTFQIADTQG